MMDGIMLPSVGGVLFAGGSQGRVEDYSHDDHAADKLS